MPKLPPPLYLDEDVSIVVAAILVARGFLAVIVRDSKQLGRTDSEQLAFAADSNSVFLTHNRIDFQRLHREWLESGRPHSGIIVARRRSSGELAARVGRLLCRLDARELHNQLFYV